MKMSESALRFAFFTVGAVIGSAVTWFLVKKSAEKELEENEIADDIPEVEAQTEPEEDHDSIVVEEYARAVNDLGYSENTTEKEGGTSMSDKPYVIDPDDFGKCDNDAICLDYYSDNVLADNWGEILDIEETIGLEALAHWGDYDEPDTIYVRNNLLMADYEVCRHLDTYGENFDEDTWDESYVPQETE